MHSHADCCNINIYTYTYIHLDYTTMTIIFKINFRCTSSECPHWFVLTGSSMLASHRIHQSQHGVEQQTLGNRGENASSGWWFSILLVGIIPNMIANSRVFQYKPTILYHTISPFQETPKKASSKLTTHKGQTATFLKPKKAPRQTKGTETPNQRHNLGGGTRDLWDV